MGMSLEKFFQDGNKLAVYGSFIYSPESAQDIDFTLFTRDGIHHFPCAPQYSSEVRSFIASQLGKTNPDFDFSGRGDKSEPSPYNLHNLPTNSRRLDNILLTGEFFPDAQFLVQHYKGIFGEQYLVETWLRHMADIQNLPIQGLREDKRDKDLLLAIRATERLIQNGYERLIPIVKTHRNAYNAITKGYKEREITIIDYDKRIGQLVPQFISEVAEFLHLDKAA